METNNESNCKIVLNGCFGGFGLSYPAMHLYLTSQGKDACFYVDLSEYEGYTKKPKFKLISLSEINSENYKHKFIYCTTEYQGNILDYYPENVVNFSGIDRTDPVLVSVVETMGSSAASGRFAELKIHELPSGTLYKIDEYDGLESLITQDDDDWLTAKENKCSEDIVNKMAGIWSLIKPEPARDPDLTFKD